MTTKEKLSALREKMQANHIDAFIVYSADPHMSEYLPVEWQERSWLSGFTGSAGFVVVTRDHAALWTDGRYFVQAAQELKDSGIELMKDGVEGTPNYIDWIVSQISKGGRVAVNALATSHVNWKELIGRLEAKGIDLVDLPLLDEIWTERGIPSQNPVFVHPDSRAGKTAAEKLADIRQKMNEKGATVHVISSLDDVAWTLNLRGSDVECNPVFLAYLVLTLDDAVLFTDLEKLDVNARKQLDTAFVKMKPYDEFYPYLASLKHEKILVAPNSNQSIYRTLEENNEVLVAPVPGNLMKAVKNDTELEGFRKVMVRDGVAMVKFLYWLTHSAGKEAMDEYSIGEKLESFRAQGENFVGVSFNSIVGYQENGAVVHYSAKKETAKKVTGFGSILVDSGAQYLEGTTDITRTFPLGEVTDEFKHDSTLVLKGMIDLAMAKFPKGTKGFHLDALARLPLWLEGKDYAHGTGHGVGSFMNVHEGPQNIRKDMNPTELVPGMVISDEPGFYVEGKYGIRHENLITVKEWKTTESGTFYQFETLTLCPFFKSIIVTELLSEEEIGWLNAYHKTVEEKLSPYLEGAVKEWFLEMVQPL